MSDESFESAYEHDENLSEVEQMLRLTGEAMRKHPELVEALRTARGQHEICFLCRHKRLFMQCIQAGALLNTMVTNKRIEMHVIFNAALIPAATFKDPSLIVSYAADFLRWQYEPEKYEQPAWYPSAPQEWDGHE